jgi:predicted ATP-dependent endonuclease of OLD family
MKIASIGVRNFRLLKEFKVHLEDELSVVIGKNNTGKTSLLSALGKFLGSGESRRLSFDDISTDQRESLRRVLTASDNVEDDQLLFSVGLELTIEYGNADDLSTVAKLITNLDPNDTRIVLDFCYELVGKRLNDLRSKWQESGGGNATAADAFLRQNLVEALGKLRRRSKSTVDGGHDIDLDRDNLSLEGVVSFKSVSARRDVTNKDNDQTLSAQAARLYRSLSGDSANEAPVEAFKTKLREADSSFTAAYADIFTDLIAKVHDFGGVRVGESAIKIASTLQHRDILSGNTTVMYEEDAYELPEHYNGLGYMNLISMIFEIDLLIKEFRKPQAGAGAALSLLFIEEPEAHTHPQMQYVFIKNIRKLLATAGEALPSLQTVLSTHSPHIVAQAEFDSIKYLQRSAQQVQAKNLRELESHFSGDDGEERRFRFLKQYLTLHRAELFFAEKVVLIEGDTERILLPAMMRKLDQSGVPKNVAPLLSQNVSVVEVGAHSQVYEKFIDFLGLRTLIITDIDSAHEVDTPDGKETRTCCPDDNCAAFTSNSSLLFYHGKVKTELDYFVKLGREGKTCAKEDGEWQPAANGAVFTAYQTKDGDYHGRSFEDAFFSINKDLLNLGHDRFSSLTKKWYDKFIADEIGPLEFAKKAVNSKPSLAIEVLLNSEENPPGNAYSNWRTPAYIEEGLKWLRGDFDE